MKLKNFFAIIGFLLLLGCNTSSHESDSAQKAKEQLTYELPAFLQLTEFEVLASENTGDDVDPQIKGRFKASVQLIEPLYTADDKINGKTILSQAVAGDKHITVNGKYTAWLQNSEWRVNLNYATQFVGQPLSNWTIGTAVIKGSEEYNTLMKNHEQAELEAIKKREERNRLEALEREKTAKLEEKLRQERVEREAIARKKHQAEQEAETQRKAEAEKKRQAEREARRLQAEKEQQAAEALAKQEQAAKAAEIEAKKAALREKLVGTWVASSNIMNTEGVSFDSGKKCTPSSSVRFNVLIPNIDSDVIDSEITLYLSDKPSVQVKRKVSVQVSSNGETVQINMPANAVLHCKNPYGHSREAITTSGFPWIGKVGKQWDVWQNNKKGKKTGWHIVLRKQKAKK